MGHTHDSCVCRAEHSPAALDMERHHIWPMGLGGPDVPENLVTVCPTTHTNIHELLREIQKRDGAMSFRDACDMFDVPVSRYAWSLAVEGYRRVQARSCELASDSRSC